MFVKPSDDPSRAVLRDHVTKDAVPAEGIEVPDFDPYWLRRIAQGDAVRADQPASPSTTPAADPAPAEHS